MTTVILKRHLEVWEGEGKKKDGRGVFLCVCVCACVSKYHFYFRVYRITHLRARKQDCAGRYDGQVTSKYSASKVHMTNKTEKRSTCDNSLFPVPFSNLLPLQVINGQMFSSAAL